MQIPFLLKLGAFFLFLLKQLSAFFLFLLKQPGVFFPLYLKQPRAFLTSLPPSLFQQRLRMSFFSRNTIRNRLSLQLRFADRFPICVFSFYHTVFFCSVNLCLEWFWKEKDCRRSRSNEPMPFGLELPKIEAVRWLYHSISGGGQCKVCEKFSIIENYYSAVRGYRPPKALQACLREPLGACIRIGLTIPAS